MSHGPALLLPLRHPAGNMDEYGAKSRVRVGPERDLSGLDVEGDIGPVHDRGDPCFRRP